MAKRLVILTTHFGSNFSGGSTATCEVFSRLQEYFEEVHVIGTELGEHNFARVIFHRYRSWLDAIKQIRELNAPSTLFYGDFYNSFLFILAGVDFRFTYHDNWPELGRFGWGNWVRSLFYTTIYQWIFRRSAMTVTVSQFKYEYVTKFSPNSVLINNGFNNSGDASESGETLDRSSEKCLLMVGNVDRRKYQLAPQVIAGLPRDEAIEIHIYGHIIDRKLAEKLAAYPQVQLRGFQSPIPYRDYHALLHTSVAESFGMVFCEAMAKGLPVIAFDTGGASELVGESGGLLIPPFDIPKMTEAVRLLTSRKSRISRPDVVENYSWDKTSRRYKETLELC